MSASPRATHQQQRVKLTVLDDQSVFCGEETRGEGTEDEIGETDEGREEDDPVTVHDRGSQRVQTTVNVVSGGG